MAIDVNISGNGSIGPIQPGWSIEESVNGLDVGGTQAGFGGVSFSAAAKDDTAFIINNDVTTTTDFGSISGNIKNVSVTGSSASINHSTKLQKFDYDGLIPVLGAGGVAPAVDLTLQLSGESQVLVDDYKYWSLNGHSSGFVYDSATASYNLVEGSQDIVKYTYYSISAGDWVTDYVNTSKDVVWANSFYDAGNILYGSSPVYGDTFSASYGEENEQFVAFKFLLGGGSGCGFDFTGFPVDTNIDSGLYVDVNYYSTNLLRVSIEFPAGGIWINEVVDVSTPTLDTTGELAMFAKFYFDAPNRHVYIDVQVCNTADYSDYYEANLSQSLFSGKMPTYFDSWGVGGSGANFGARAFLRKSSHATSHSSLSAPAEYESLNNYSLVGANTVGGPVPAVTGNAWDYVQQACMVYQKEVVVLNDVITIRDVAAQTLDISNIVAFPTFSLSSNFTGKFIEINYTNSENVANDEVYNAYVLNEDYTVKTNNILEVQAGELVETTLESETSFGYVFGSTYSNIGNVNHAGHYTVIDSTGVRLPEDMWAGYGGSLKCSVSSEVPGGIDVSLHGPTIEVPAYPGPYKVAVSSGNEYGALSIFGSGVKTNIKTLKLRTGAPDDTTQEIAKSIDNPFIATAAQAYDCGVWASIKACGPTVTLSGSIPSNAIDGLGLVAGSIITYGDSQYRIVSSTISNMSVSFSAERHVTVGDFDTLWNGDVVGVHDTAWSGYRTQDQLIAPFLFG